MYTLGINAVYHDPAACLVRNGEVLAAAEEERFTHVKHGKRPIPFSTYELPYHAVDYCLAAAGIRLADVDHVAYSYAPQLLLNGHSEAEAIPLPLRPTRVASPWTDGQSPWDPLFLCSIVNAPEMLADGAPHHLQERFRGAVNDGRRRWHFVEHHVAHAASAFLASPFDRAAVMTLDGRGEIATTSYGRAAGTSMEMVGQVDMPHSLGLLYEEVTGHLGFLHSSDEYKVMALASFGKPAYLDEFRQIIDLQGNGQYTIGPRRLAERFGPARQRGGPLEQRHYDVAHSLQVALEETVLELARWLHATTKEPNLALAGGVALNCVMNARLRDRGPFQQVWVQPAAGDAGTALGAALWVDLQQRQGAPRCYRMDHAFLGPDYDDKQIKTFLDWTGVAYRKLENVAEETADLLVEDKIIGWFQGRMEFGPRAGGPLDPRLAPGCGDAREAQQHQGSRGLPSRRAGGPGRGCCRLVPRRDGVALHALCLRRLRGQGGAHSRRPAR